MEKKSGKKGWSQKCRFVFRVIALFLAVCLLFSGRETVNAAEEEKEEFGFVETSISLYTGNTYQLETVNAEPVVDEFGWSDSVSFFSSDPNIVRVDTWNGSVGIIRAVGAGKADITAYFMGKTAVCHVKVKPTHCELSEEKLVLYQGQEAEITLTNSKQKAASYDYFIYTKEDNYESDWSLEVEENGKGVFTIKGCEAGEYYLDLSLTNRKGESYSARCEVEVLECGFLSNNVSVAEGGTVALEIANGEILSCEVVQEESYETEDKEDWWEESQGTEDKNENTDSSEDWQEDARTQNPSSADWEADEDNLTVDNQGNLTGILAGEAKISVKWQAVYGEEREDILNVYITTPEYIPFENKLFAGDWYYPNFEGTSYYSKISSATSSNDDVLEVQISDWGDVLLMPKKAGKATLKFTVDGLKFQQKVQVIAPQWGQDCALVKKGKAKVLSFTNLPKDSEVVWKTSDKKIVTVSQEGKITGKKLGSAVITAELGGKTFSCTVTVGSGKGVDAALKGEKVLGAVYSQEKRMQDGYYDCSSFVWRSYNAAGLKLGNVNSAPTAAEIARKLEAEGKAIAYEYIEPDQLKPGDLIFYAGYGNGRYKNIDHVSMYYGSFYSWGDIDSGAIIHAVGSGVQFESYSWYCSGSIVMIARPVE